MQSVARFGLSIVLLSVVTYSCASSTKLRRDGVLNLYPFPRVGRSGDITFQGPRNDLIDSEYLKRQLYAFPRVGRSNSPYLEKYPVEDMIQNQPYLKRIIPEADRGMWFGARLGRSLRSENDFSPKDTQKSQPEELEETLLDRKKREAKRT